MKEADRQNYLHGAAIMTVGVIAVKILGALFKIPLGSMSLLGDEGFANFTSAYNIYTVFLTLATAGFPVALSRMISEADALHRYTQVKRTFHTAFWFLAALGIISCVLMMFFPGRFAHRLGDEQAKYGIFILGPATLLVCLISVFRGYCQGQGNMMPTTISQILEVGVKVPVGLFLAWWFVRSNRGLPLAAGGAIFGVTIGSAVALAYLVRYVLKHYDISAEGGDSKSYRDIFSDLLRIGVPITIGGCVLSVINLVDNAQILNRLQYAAGFAAMETKILYGIYGKVQTLYMLPSYFMAPFQSSVVPNIAGCMASGREEEGFSIAESSLRMATFVVLPMCVGMAVLAYPIVNVLWPGSNAAGPMLLRYLTVAAFFVCLTMLTNAILQSTGHEKLPMIGMVCGAGTKFLINHILLANPMISIRGAAISSIVCFAVMSGMNFLFISRSLHRVPSPKRFLLRPLLASFIMGLVAWVSYNAVYRLLGMNPARLPMLISIGVAVVLAVITYVFASVLTHSITAEDLRMLPKGDKLANLLHLQ